MISSARAIVCVAGLLAVSGCGDSGLPSAPTPEDFLPRFGVPPSAASAGEAERPKIRLYIDRSWSMRGFVEARGSRYQHVLSSLLDNAAASRCPFQPFGFDVKVEPLQGGGQSAESPWFYNGLKTDLRRLFAQAAPRSGEVSVVMSDFVQSAGGEDQRALAAAVDGGDAAEWQVLLLAFRSAFHGWYFVEKPGAAEHKFQVDFDGATSATGRPFYLLVLAKRRRDLDSFRRYVLADIQDDEELQPSEPALRVADVQLATEARPAADEANRWSRSQQLEGDLHDVSGSAGHVNSFIALGEGSQRMPPLRLAVTASARTPLRSISDLEIERAAKERRRAGWLDRPAVEARAEWAPAPRTEKDGGKDSPGADAGFVLTIPLARPAAGAWSLDRVRVTPGQGNLLPPLWVESWTAQDDSLPANANRTFKLRLLVEVLIRSIQERIPILDEFILVRRAE